MDYFKNLADLLKIEQTEDREAYLKQASSTSVTDRRAAGLAWYPIAITGTEPSRGDYLNVEAERKTHLDVIHQLRFGSPAVLFSNHDPKHDRVEGVISYIGGDRIKINIFTEETPDWARDGKLGIELLFDNNNYDEMFGALKQAAKLIENPVEGRLAQILTGKKSPLFVSEPMALPGTGLNQSQQAAVEKIMAAQDLAIVHGPPGTGKTTTLVQAISQIVKQQNQQVLVVAPSNTAVDLLSEKLSQQGLNVIRIGNPARVSDKLMNLTLDSQMTLHPYMKESKRLKKQAAEFKNMGHKYKRSFGKAERDQRKALFDEAHKIMKEVAKTEEFIINDLVTKAQVVTATLAGANHWTIRNLNFNTVFIDEAGQALEPACWIPILKAQKVVLAGDHCQLSPTIKSNEAARNGLSTTLIEKCIALHPEAVVLLEEQYRMNKAIMGYSSGVFYNNALKAHHTVAERLLFDGELPMVFIDTAGCGFDEKPAGTSVSNPEEAAFLFRYLEGMAKTIGDHYALADFPSVAIISPYSEQVRLLKEQSANTPSLHVYGDKISVNTIDSFQGQERDVVLISLTRSNAEGTIGFLADIRRMNVAMTRARKKLVIIGDSSTLSRLPFYAGLISYAEGIGGYQSAWEHMG
ncbi:AAA domain-containing protein [Mucilaginibacter gotjawali]|uniref:Cdc6-like AAA superfamily ATPase n=2 Tax=Mucilaginibacter gotjawali TaxID=1550579 RepID=A0A839SKE2_9SPHI|nr:AAA domain-containing protein [Mucilaginibacter gotjawali]MBB3057724.1 Cdc6-like AAA superfamily ATPase [Mucilaginibacter gotjawali]BAU52527.1 ATP-dependent RecD-like DNA helicase [Mucilaginibacter gotjawali]